MLGRTLLVLFGLLLGEVLRLLFWYFIIGDIVLPGHVQMNWDGTGGVELDVSKFPHTA